jgi:hypothetical protein
MSIKLMQKKRKGYTGDIDPMLNFRSADRWDVPPWKGAGIRGDDKTTRFIQLMSVNGRDEVTTDGLLDQVLDQINYNVIVLQLALEELPEDLRKEIIDKLHAEEKTDWPAFAPPETKEDGSKEDTRTHYRDRQPPGADPRDTGPERWEPVDDKQMYDPPNRNS